MEMENRIVLATAAAALTLGISQGWAGSLSLPDVSSGDAITAANENSRNAAIEQAVNDNDTRLGAVEGNVTDTGDHESRISTLETTSADHETRISDLEGTGGSCPDGMVQVADFCIDTYEASLVDRSGGATNPTNCAIDGNNCSDKDTTGAGADGTNNTTAIYAQSAAGVAPVANISWFQAAQACANVGKRLPTNQEWQIAAAGTNAADCNVSQGSVDLSDANPNCISNWGAINMVGNVSEWVADWIAGSGGGTSGTQGPTWGDDRYDGVREAQFQDSDSHMPAAMVRGGDNNDGTGAGIFVLDATTAPSNDGNSNRGFRCAKTL